MRGTKHIVFCLLLIIPMSVQTLYAQSTRTVEQEQQFLYYFYEAQRLIQAQDLETAWEVMQFCHELNPDDATVNNYMGCFLEAMQRAPEALPYFKQAYLIAPNEYWYRYTLMLLQSEDKKQHKAAIHILENVAQDNPKDADVREMLQKAYAVEGEYKKALLLQDKLDSINGYDAMSAMQRYRLNVLMHNVKQAVAEVERYLDLDPDNYQFQVFRMQLYEQTRQPAEKMVQAYASVLRLDPRNLMIINNLAWCLCITGGDLDYAEQLSRSTIMREPSNPIFLDTYAWIMYQKGDYETAWFYIQRAAEHADAQTDKEIQSHYKAIRKKQKQ